MYGEALFISILLGVYWQSWWVFGGVFLALSIVVSIYELAIVFSLLMSALWFLIVGQILSQWGGTPAFVVAGIIAFFVSYGLHYEVIVKNKIDKNRVFLGRFFEKATVGLEQTRQIPEKVRTYVWRRDQGKCVKCGSQERLEFDHIIPFSRGGSNTERNIQLLCEKCNREKRATI